MSTLCTRLGAAIISALCFLSWCPPSCQPCVHLMFTLLLAVMSILCPGPSAKHHADRHPHLFSCHDIMLESPSLCPAYCQLGVPVHTTMSTFFLRLGPAITFTLRPRLSARHHVHLALLPTIMSTLCPRPIAILTLIDTLNLP